MAKQETFIKPSDLDEIADLLTRVGRQYSDAFEKERLGHSQVDTYRKEAIALIKKLRDLGLQPEFDFSGKDGANVLLTLDPYELELGAMGDRTMLRMPAKTNFPFTYNGLRDFLERELPFTIYGRALDRFSVLRNTHATLKDLGGDTTFDGNIGDNKSVNDFAKALSYDPASVRMDTKIPSGGINYGFFATNSTVLGEFTDLDLYLPNNVAINPDSMNRILSWNRDSRGVPYREMDQYARNIAAGYNGVRLFNFQKREIPVGEIQEKDLAE